VPAPMAVPVPIKQYFKNTRRFRCMISQSWSSVLLLTQYFAALQAAVNTVKQKSVCTKLDLGATVR
jgi:hypothetical protein